MAEKIKIDVELSAALKQSREDFAKLQEDKAFVGQQGDKRYQKIQGMLTSLESIDLSKLAGPALTRFLKQLEELRTILDKSSYSLTSYTKQQEEAIKALEDAKKARTDAQTKKATALEKKKTAAENIKNQNQYVYFNKKTGESVSNIDTIAKLIQTNQLDIKTQKGNATKLAHSDILKNNGLQAYADASKEHAQALDSVRQATDAVKKAQEELAKLTDPTTTPPPHPTTTSVTGHSSEIGETIQKIRDVKTEKDESDIKNIASTKEMSALDVKKIGLDKAFKAFTLYNIAIQTAKRALQEAVQTVKELDKYLTEQAMVTGMTREQTYKLVGTYQDLALQCGATTKEIAQVSTEYMKQGKTIQESLVLTEAAVKAAKVARVSVSDSVNYLTTALNGFQLATEDAMKVSDKFAAVAASSATDYDELAIALSKVASQANLAGMSIDYTTALLTKGLETTREAPETMGTALKTIIARMRELSDYGETLEGDTDVNNVESQLAYVGIALRDTNGELRSTEEVLDELGKK